MIYVPKYKNEFSEDAKMLVEENGEVFKADMPKKNIQPDWNQNDTSAEDYIKNRPFSQEIVYGDVYCKKQELVIRLNEYNNLEMEKEPEFDIYPMGGNTLEVRINDIPYHVTTYTSEGFPYFNISDANCPITRWFDGSSDLNTDVVYDGYVFTFEVIKRTININPIDFEFIDTIPIEKGGTGATNASSARNSLGIGIAYCSTKADVAEKVITDFSNYKDYGILFVKFSYANTASSPSLKINNDTRAIHNISGNYISPNDIGKAMHLFVYQGGAWYLINPMS